MSWPNTDAPKKPTTEPKYTVGKIKGKITLSPEQEELFRKLFPKTLNLKLMQLFGLSHATLHRMVRELGLTKNEKIIRHKQAMLAKRTCERNGYYDSIRGKKPSEACLEAFRRKRAAGFNPLLALKEKNPRKYKAAMKRRSEARKELFRKEELRQRYGLPRKTKLRMKTVTHKMSSQKHLMIKRRDYYAIDGRPDWIGYDDQTRRSRQMEDTAKRHGLKVVQSEEYTGKTDGKEKAI